MYSLSLSLSLVLYRLCMELVGTIGREWMVSQIRIYSASSAFVQWNTHHQSHVYKIRMVHARERFSTAHSINSYGSGVNIFTAVSDIAALAMSVSELASQ